MKKIVTLSGRELDIMKILWNEDTALGASEIAQLGSLSINTVQAVLKSLLQRKFIKVADIVYSGTVLSRRYAAELTANSYIRNNLLDYASLKSTFSVFASLIEDETDVEIIDKLEDVLQKRKKELHME